VGACDRVEEEDAGCDPRHQEQVAALVARSTLDPIGCVAELVDRRTQVVAYVLVDGDTGGLCADATWPPQPVGDASGRDERVLEVLSELLVPDRALDVRPDVLDAVLCLHHSGVPFIRFAILYPAETNR